MAVYGWISTLRAEAQYVYEIRGIYDRKRWIRYRMQGWVTGLRSPSPSPSPSRSFTPGFVHIVYIPRGFLSLSLSLSMYKHGISYAIHSRLPTPNMSFTVSYITKPTALLGTTLM